MAAGIVLFALLTYLVVTGRTESFDQSVRSAVLGIRCGALSAVLVPLSLSGNWHAVVPVCLVLLAIPDTRFSYGIPLSASEALTVTLYQISKRIIRRPRPDAALFLVREHGFSFPSGHSLTSFSTFLLLIALLWYYYRTKGQSLRLYTSLGSGKPRPAVLYPRTKKALAAGCALCVIYMLLMGFSRIYVGVHWPTDVLGGFSFGMVLTPLLERLFVGGVSPSEGS